MTRESRRSSEEPPAWMSNVFCGFDLRARAKITTHSWTPTHPVGLRCSSPSAASLSSGGLGRASGRTGRMLIYLDIIHFSRLAIRAPRRPRMGIYSCPDPKARADVGEKAYASRARSIQKVYFERTFVNVSRLTFLPLTTSTTV